MALAPFAPGGVQVRRTAEMFVQLRQQGLLSCEGLHLRRTAQHRAQRRRHRRAQVGAAPRQLLW